MIRLSIYAKARAGKSTAARYLVKNHRFVSVSFGKKVKQYYHKIFGKPNGKDREGYQWFGQTMRQRDPLVWIRQVDPLIRRGIEKEWNIVVDDMRQPNEYEYLKSLGFVMVRVDCPDEIRLERMRKAGDILPDDPDELKAVLDHETERYVDQFEPDFVIDGSGTIAEMCKQIDKVIEIIKNGA